MCQELQRNFEIIQYLVKDASPEQLIWRTGEGQCLSEILCHLRDVEKWHARADVPGLDYQRQPVWSVGDLSPNTSTANGEYAFETYARYRQETVTALQKVPAAAWQRRAVHKLFGEITVAELVQKIDETDHAHIRQIENVIHRMPLNPLFARALQEIGDYHRRYQAHLGPAASLLDIGVGTGLALRHVMQQNPHLTCTGVDIRDLRLPEVRVPLRVYDGQTLPFVENQFDVSLLFYVIHHCENPERVLDEATRVTRQKLIIIEEFHRPGADAASLDLTERQSHRALGIPPDLPYRLFDKSEFEQILCRRYLLEVEQQLLPSKTTRPVQKYLYVCTVPTK